MQYWFTSAEPNPELNFDNAKIKNYEHFPVGKENSRR